MSGTLIWHDTRLAGYPDPAAADLVVSVNRGTPLSQAIARIGNFANGHGGADRLSIMCHGFEKIHESPTARMSITIGGTGLQICRENLRHNNVDRMAALNGFIREIVVYACGAADTHPDMVGTNWDGRRLFGELSIHTGAVVYAADVTQYYFRIHNAIPNASSDIIDFRGWEGNLWRFTPDGRPGTIVESNPITAR